MTADGGQGHFVGLIRELCKLPTETEWVEFKVNHRNPRTIGEYVSALSDAAALHDKVHAYILWRIEDGMHADRRHEYQEKERALWRVFDRVSF